MNDVIDIVELLERQTNFTPIFYFYTPRKRQETFGYSIKNTISLSWSLTRNIYPFSQGLQDIFGGILFIIKLCLILINMRLGCEICEIRKACYPKKLKI